MVILYIFAGLAAVILLFFVLKLAQLKKGREKAHRDLEMMDCEKLPFIGTVKNLSILPIIDFYSTSDELRTEPGVSYLVKADDTTILLDVGYNTKKEHPSPLMLNMEKLDVKIEDIDMMFISHLHVDHLGGMKEQREKQFSLSQGPVPVPEVPVYAPDEVTPSEWNPNPRVEVVSEPKVIKEGIASIGPIPRFLFLMGYTLEHSLAVNVEGKGIVLIIGCGHQTIEKIIERARCLFDEPIYGIIGGLHFPVNGGRIMAGPFNIQLIVGSDNPPWRGISEQDVMDSIEATKKEDPRIVSLSAHDSSDWSIDKFKEAFGDRYRDLKVGEEIVI
ncbi:MAG: MBL fold metallo-hydrolase [Thermodesulfobacteriota bacterium]|nr:MBL fold metallo-hydrolase [Thermodesulfobacteriota bacterium]